MVAKKQESVAAPDGYLVMVSPFGIETTVPEDIKYKLLESGYAEK